MIEIETSRLLLKGIDISTFHTLFRNHTDQELMVFFGVEGDGFDFYKEIHEKGGATFRISQFFFVLQRKEDGRAIGECGFHTWNTFHKKAELYYKLHQDAFKNKGYMGEALKEIIEFGFLKLDLHRIQALIDPNNLPSFKLLKKNGFELEGRLKEDYCVNGIFEDSDSYCLLRPNWELRNVRQE